MKAQNEYWGGVSGISPLIPQNTYTEFIGGYSGYSGIEVPVVRALEESDPVYYMVADSPFADLKARDKALASFVTSVSGGIFSKDIWSFNNDTSTPFEYGILGKTATSNFTSTATCKAWAQFVIPGNVRAGYDLNMKMVFAMSTSLASKVAKINFDYDLIKRTDIVTAPTVTASNSEEFAVPATANELGTYTSVNYKITAAQLAALGADLTHAVCAFSLERVNTGLVGDNHSGTFQLIGVTFYQTI